MKVRELMKRKVITVDIEDPVDRVFFLIHFEKIRHLPVLERKQCVGIVSDRDLYKALGPRGKRNWVASAEAGETSLHVVPRKVRHIMHRGVITVDPETHVANAASIMAGKKIGALPVVKSKRLVGILTATDILEAFSRMFMKAWRRSSSSAGIPSSIHPIRLSQRWSTVPRSLAALVSDRRSPSIWARRSIPI